MNLLDIILVGLGLSMDAFAVCLCVFAAGRVNGFRPAFRLSFHFGLFQFLMPVAGWTLGRAVEPLIRSFDHWIAYALLALVGCRMIAAATGAEEEAMPCDPTRGWSLVGLSVATSIDAFAVGLSLAMFDVSIWQASVLIGAITALVCVIGIRIGNFAGARFGKRMELAGGIVLNLIGLRILVEHLWAHAVR